jgi:hypothetical protein
MPGLSPRCDGARTHQISALEQIVDFVTHLRAQQLFLAIRGATADFGLMVS